MTPTGISDSSVTSAVTISSVKLGDFVAEEAVEQNEYIVININEGNINVNLLFTEYLKY